MSAEPHLSRRERQIMDALHQRGRATAAEVQAALPDPPGYSAVRALLRILEAKGHVKHLKEGSHYVYQPRVSRETARRSALQRLVSTFFAAQLIDSKRVAGRTDWLQITIGGGFEPSAACG